MKNFKLNFAHFFRTKTILAEPFSSQLGLLEWKLPTMPCFNNFCCGYGLRSGGSFIGYFSITVYIKLFILSVIFLWCIKNRIDESEGLVGWSFSNLLRFRANNYEIESIVQELRSEKIYKSSSDLILFNILSLQRDLHRLSAVPAFRSSMCVIFDNWSQARESFDIQIHSNLFEAFIIAEEAELLILVAHLSRSFHHRHCWYCDPFYKIKR